MIGMRYSMKVQYVSEKMRLRLLEVEFKMRAKQPQAWTKTKYRPYANFRTKKEISV